MSYFLISYFSTSKKKKHFNIYWPKVFRFLTEIQSSASWFSTEIQNSSVTRTETFKNNENPYRVWILLKCEILNSWYVVRRMQKKLCDTDGDIQKWWKSLSFLNTLEMRNSEFLIFRVGCRTVWAMFEVHVLELRVGGRNVWAMFGARVLELRVGCR